MLYSTRLHGVFCAAFLLLCHLAISQKYVDPDTFSGVRSEGTIPEDFTESWARKYKRKFHQGGASQVSGNKDELEKFWSSQYYFIDGLLQNGRISFNDPVSRYLNNIKNELLKNDPELRDEIRVYFYRNPNVNALTVADGIILFNSGLIAAAKNEAELAFVMAHEIQHYVLGHSFQSFEKREQVLRENMREYRNLHPIRKEELLTMQSKEHEFEADEAGMRMYLQSAYHSEAPHSLLSLLHHSYIPYGRHEVGDDFLATGDHKLPEIFFRDEVDSISREEDYFDETHTHPNISKRREALKFIKGDGSLSSNEFIQSKEEFFAIRELARFERVRELLIYGRYGEALYDIYGLQKEYPNSRFLDLASAEAIYSLASFKSKRGAFRAVAVSTSGVEGPSQQVHHVIKQFDRSQLCAYALRVVRDQAEKYPDAKHLDQYASELAKHLLVGCHLTENDFEVTATALPPFEKTVNDFSSERKFMRARQQHYRDLYKYYVQPEKKSGWLATEMKRHQWIVDSTNAHYEMDRREKRDKMDDLEDEFEEGSGIKVRDVVFLDPVLYMRKDDQDKDDFAENFEKEQEFKAELPQVANEVGINAQFLFSSEIKSTDVDRYNKLCKLKEWISIANIYGSHELLPPLLDHSEELKKEFGARYVCKVEGRIQDGFDSYRFVVLDLNDGRIVYRNQDTKGFKLSKNDLLKETEDDLQNLYN